MLGAGAGLRLGGSPSVASASGLDAIAQHAVGREALDVSSHAHRMLRSYSDSELSAHLTTGRRRFTSLSQGRQEQDVGESDSEVSKEVRGAPIKDELPPELASEIAEFVIADGGSWFDLKATALVYRAVARSRGGPLTVLGAALAQRAHDYVMKRLKRLKEHEQHLTLEYAGSFEEMEKGLRPLEPGSYEWEETFHSYLRWCEETLSKTKAVRNHSKAARMVTVDIFADVIELGCIPGDYDSVWPPIAPLLRIFRSVDWPRESLFYWCSGMCRLVTHAEQGIDPPVPLWMLQSFLEARQEWKQNASSTQRLAESFMRHHAPFQLLEPVLQSWIALTPQAIQGAGFYSGSQFSPMMWAVLYPNPEAVAFLLGQGVTPFEACYMSEDGPTSVLKELRRRQRLATTTPEELQALSQIQQALEAVPDLSIERVQNTAPDVMAEWVSRFFQKQAPARVLFGLSPNSAADLDQRVAILQGILQKPKAKEVVMSSRLWGLTLEKVDGLIQEAEDLVRSGKGDQCRR